MNVGIGTWPARRAIIQPDDVALEFEGVTKTFAAFSRRVSRLANALIAAGVDRGDRVAVASFNHPSVLELFFATALIGAIWVPINPRLRTPEIEYILRDCEPVVVAYGAQQTEAVEQLAPVLDVASWLSIDEGGPGAPIEGFMHSGSDTTPEVEVDGENVAILMYTSGTTGSPKGAMLTHDNLHHQYMNALMGQDLRQDEVHLAVSPLFHSAGLNAMAVPVLGLGGRIVIHRMFDPHAVLREIARSRVTSMFMVPAMLDALALSPGFADADLSSLRAVMVGGSPVPERTIRAYLDRDVPLTQGYGMTEASPAVTMLEARDSLAKVGSAGKAHFFTEFRLVDRDGRDVPTGEAGEIIIRGPNVMKGYWRKPEDTELVLAGGWLRSGDVGVVDEDGYLYIRDRLKDLYISGGENVYPAEVENEIMNIPGVVDAAVIGVPDERWGEAGCAFIVPGPDLPGVDEIKAHLKTRLATYKVPRDVYLVDELPRTTSGKVRKHNLRAQQG